MKRFILLVMLAILTIGCGLSEATEGTTSKISVNNQASEDNDTIEVTAESVNCDIHPIVDSSEAGVTCQIEVIEDAFIWAQSKDPFIIFAGGQLKVNDQNFIFKHAAPFAIEGSGTLNACEVKVPWEINLFYPCDLPFMTLIPQIERETGTPGTSVLSELPFDIEITFSPLAVTQQPPNTNIRLTEAHASFMLTECRGFLIPNSSLAGIIMIGEFKGQDQPVSILGTMDTGTKAKEEFLPFDCSLNSQEMTVNRENENIVIFNAQTLGLKMNDGTVWDLKNTNIIVTTEAMLFDAQEGFIIFAE